jgi:hypothetical protein
MADAAALGERRGADGWIARAIHVAARSSSPMRYGSRSAAADLGVRRTARKSTAGPQPLRPVPLHDRFHHSGGRRARDAYATRSAVSPRTAG